MPADVGFDNGTSIVAAAFHDPEGNHPTPINGTVRWTVIGPGVVDPAESSLESGYAITTLKSTSGLVGDIIKVKAEIIDSPSLKGQSGNIQITSGATSDIVIQRSAAVYPGDGTSIIDLTAIATDRFGNPVADRPCMWTDSAIGGLVETNEATDANGRCNARIQAGEFEETQKISVQIDLKRQDTNVNVIPVLITLKSNRKKLDIYLNQKAKLTAFFTDKNGNKIADGTPVKWFASLGNLTADTVIINGQASAVLSSTGGRIGNCQIVVGLKGSAVRGTIEFFSTANIWASADDYFLIDGGSGTAVQIHGPPNGSAQLTVAEMLVAFFPFSTIDNGKVTDQVTQNKGVVFNATLDPDHYSSPPASLLFSGSGYVNIPDIVQYHVSTDFAIGAAIRLSALGDFSILSKAAEYSLTLGTDGKVTFTIHIGASTFSVTSSEVLETDKWYSVRGALSSGQMILTVKGVATTQAVAGSITSGSSPIIVGAELTGTTFGRFFEGNIDDVFLSKLGLLSISGLDPSGAVSLDSSGNGTIHISESISDPDNPLGTFTLAATVFNASGHKVGDIDEDYVRIDPTLWNQVKSAFENGVVLGKAIVEALANAATAGDSLDYLKDRLLGVANKNEHEFLYTTLAILDVIITGKLVIVGIIWKSSKTFILTLSGPAAASSGAMSMAAVATAAPGNVPKLASIVALIMRGAAVSAEAAVTVSKEYEALFEFLTKSGLAAKAGEVCTARKTLKSLAKLHQVGGNQLVEFALKVPADALVKRDFIEVMAKLQPAKIKSILENKNAVYGLAKVLNGRANAVKMNKFFSNTDIVIKGYDHAQLLVDIEKVVHVPGVEVLVRDLAGANNFGRSTELAAAVQINKTDKVVALGQPCFWNKPLKNANGKKMWVVSDIDVVGTQYVYSVKSSKDAFKKTVAGEISLMRAMAKAKPPGLKPLSNVRLMVRNKAHVGKKLKDEFEKLGGVIEIVNI